MKVTRLMVVAAIVTLVSAGRGVAEQIGSEIRLGSALASFAVQLASSDDSAPTPTDQGNSETDRNITAHIRREIVANDGLSMNAHNVKIITTDGIVTLRGPVKSPQEKAWVAAVAHRAPGVKRVDDQLEVERNQ